MCDCFHLAFPNWHAASETGVSRRLRGPEPGTEDDSVCDEPPQFTEGERPRPQGSSPVEEYPETEKYADSDKEFEAEHDPHHKSGTGKRTKKSGLGSMFEKRSTPKMSKLKEVPSPESGVIVKSIKDGCAEGLVYGGGGKDGIFIKEVVPESPATKSLGLKEGDQVLSATVYFDNMPYEDAIQILDHAQAYNVTLCLKRKPVITETEPVITSDIIPEEELGDPEMREHGKTKRRGDARISWPKFPSFGKGRKSRFTRSHSSSEADEQRKLELSPTTSDTESPIKSQDALKGKKRHKMKLSVLTKAGRISPSEEQCLESPSGETPEEYLTEDPIDQNYQKLAEPQSVQHKVELITIDSTLKTTDLTVALADKESPSGIKSPDGKKKKKERSEFKMKILGKDKLHKKDAKAKSSPKRLKTLGASIEIADQPENKKSDAIPSFEPQSKLHGDQLKIDPIAEMISNDNTGVISAEPITSQMEIRVPKMELDVDVPFIGKSPQKSEEKVKKAKEVKQKEDTKTGPMFKLPKVGFGDFGTDETIQKMNANAEECTIKTELRTTEGVKVKDPYEQLSSRKQLPKREEIEIPGMEDISMRTRLKGLKHPKAGLMGQHEELQAETVPLSIDVDSVKEAVSKLPGYKLPKVDTSGVPIPEEITVIDANAQRISVKTPTKVVDPKTKHESYFTKFDITASPDISKTTMKLPKVTPGDLTSEELLLETKVHLTTDKIKYKSKIKESDKQIDVDKREDIIIPGIESAQDTEKIHDTDAIKAAYESTATLSPKESDRKSRKAKVTSGFRIAKPNIKIPDVGIHLPKQKKDSTLKGEGKDQGHIGGIISDVKIPDIDSIEYIDSVGGSLPEVPEVDTEKHVSIPKEMMEVERPEMDGQGSKFKMQKLEITMPEVKGPEIELSSSKKNVEVTLPEAKTELQLPGVEHIEAGVKTDVKAQEIVIHQQDMEEALSKFKIPKLKLPKFGIASPKVSVKTPDLDKDAKIDAAFVTLPEVKTELQLPDVEHIEAGAKTDIKAQEIAVRQQDVEEALSKVKIPKFKLPKFGIASPKVSVKTPDLDKDAKIDAAFVTLPEGKTELQLLDVEHIEAGAKTEVKAQEIAGHQHDVEGALSKVKIPKFKLPKFGIVSPNVSLKSPGMDKEVKIDGAYVTLPEAKTELGLLDVEHIEPGVRTDVKAQEIAVHQRDVEGALSKVKIPKLKLPKFGIASPKVSVKTPDLDKDSKVDAAFVTLPEAKTELRLLDVEHIEPGVKTDVKAQEIAVHQRDVEEALSKVKIPKFKLPKFGIASPKVSVKTPDLDKDAKIDVAFVTLPEAKTELRLLDVEHIEPGVKTEVKAQEIAVPQRDIEEALSKVKIPKLKLPKFGIVSPNVSVKSPGMDKEVKIDGDYVTLPEAKTELQLLDVEHIEPGFKTDVNAQEIAVHQQDFEEALSKVKIPKLKLPKFGIVSPKVSGNAPDMDKEVKIDGAYINIPEKRLAVNIEAPSVDVKGSPIDMKQHERGRKVGKFEMPHLNLSMPKVKAPKLDFSISKNKVDATLPEGKTNVTFPEVDLGGVNASIPDIKMEVPENKVEVTLPEDHVTMKPPECKVEMDAHDGKFKIPKFGIKMPKVKGPQFDLSLGKKDVDQLSETNSDIKPPDMDLGKVDVSIPEAMVEVKNPDLELPSMKIEGELDGQGGRFEKTKFGIKMPQMKVPEFGLSSQKKDIDVKLPPMEVKLADAPKMDVQLGNVEVFIPEEVEKPQLENKSLQAEEVLSVDIAAPSIDIEGPSIEMKTKGTEAEGKRSKFKMPRLSFSGPQVKQPVIDLSLSKKDVDVTLQEAKAEVKVPDVELKQPSAEVEIKAPEIKVATTSTDGSPSKFKLPTFKFPKFGVGTKRSSIELPDMDKDVQIDGADIRIPEEVLSVDIAAPSIDIEGPPVQMKTIGGEDEGKGGKFKMPSLSFSGPQVKRPEIDLSLSKKDVDVTLPEAKAEVKVPDVQLEKPTAEVEIKAPEIKVATTSTDGSPSRFKLPTFKFPKFGVGTKGAAVELPDTDKDVQINGAEIQIPEEVLSVDIGAPSIDIEGPSVQMKTTGGEDEGKGGKFKMPSLGFSGPQVKRPEIDLSLSKKDVDVTLPEAKAEVKVPDIELKQPSAEVEIKAPKTKIATTSTEGSPSKFKLPTFKFPKFGVGTKGSSIELPDMDKDVQIDGAEIKIPEEVLSVEFAAPSIDIEGPSVQMKTTGGEDEGKGGKFKMPKLSFSGPQVKRPEIDLSLSKKDVDVILPEAKAEVKVPDIERKQPSADIDIKAPEIKVATTSTDGSPSKFKLPTFKFPKFGVGTKRSSMELPDRDKDVQIDGAEIKIPEEVLSVDIGAPSIDIEGPSIQMKTTGPEDEGKGGKFKMQSLSFSGPQVKRPEIDLSLSKKDVDVTLPEAKAEVKAPDVQLEKPSLEVEIKAPEIKVATTSTEGSPSRFNLPTFKVPKFGVGTKRSSIELPYMDKDVQIDGAEIKIPEEVLSVDIAAPSIDIEGPSVQMKTTGGEDEGKGGKFKMPRLSFSGPQVKRPEIDLSLPKKAVDVTLPEAKAEVKVPDIELKQPSADIEIKAPEIKVATKSTEGSPSKFKLPTFKFPKFGIGTKGSSVELPDMDKDVQIDGAEIKIPEEVLSVDIGAPSIDIEGPSVQMKTTGTEDEGKGGKFKMPSLSFSGPQVKQPEIDLSLSKKDVDVTLPEAKAEVKVLDVQLEKPSAEVEIKVPEIKVATTSTEGSPSRFKLPTFKFPKFGVGTKRSSIELPDIDKDVQIDGAEIKIPEEVLSVDIAAPSIDIEGPSIQMKTTGTEDEGKGGKFKMPSLNFSGPQVKQPEIDLSLSKKDVDVTLPEAKAEVKVPDVQLEKPSAEVEIKAPEIKVATTSTEGSPSRFNLPTFKFPKFGFGTKRSSIELPDIDKDVQIDGAEIKIPEEVLSVEFAAPSIDIEGPSVQMKTTGGEDEGKGGKFKMPRLSFSGPQVKRPEIDLSLSKKDVDVTLPEAKAEVKVPDVQLEKPFAEVEIKAPETKVATKSTDGSPSKLKLPTFKFPKFGVGTKRSSIELPDIDKDVQIDGAEIKIPEEVLSVDIGAPSIDIEGPSMQMKTTGTEDEGKGGKFKMPSLSFSGPQVKQPEIDLSLSKKDVDLTLPEANAEVSVPVVQLERPSADVEIKAPEIKVATTSTEGSPSRFKLPTFKFPKFGVGTKRSSIELLDMDKDIQIDGAEIKIPEEVLRVDISAPSIDIEGQSIDMKTTGTEDEGKGGKFKMPSLSFSGPQVKRPEIDLSLPNKDVDVTLPEAKAEVKVPDVQLEKSSAEVEIKAPEIKVATTSTEGSPSRFKLPTFKFPKFGVGTKRSSIELPDMDKDIQIDGAEIKIPEEVLSVEFAAPSIDIEGPSIDTKTTGTEDEGKGGKFKMPSLSFSGPQVKRPEIDLSLPKKDVDVTLPEAKAEVQVPDVQLEKPTAEVEIKAPEIKVATTSTEGSPSRFKLPTFKFPKFGVGTKRSSMELPDTDKDVQIDGAEIKIPEEVLSVEFTAPSIDIEGPPVQMKTTGTEDEGKGGKFKMPSLGFSGPQVKRPEIDLSLSKKDVDVTLPEAKAEVQVPDVQLEKPTAEVEIKAPEIKVATTSTEGSPSRFKLPTFKFPKFGVGTKGSSMELPDMDKDVQIDGAEIKIPEEVLRVDISAPSIDIEGPSIDMKTTGGEDEGKESKFKMPSLSFSGPQVKRPEIDLSLSKKDVDVTLPEAKAEVQVPDVQLEKPTAEVEIKAPEIKVATTSTEGSPSRFKLPTFKFPKFGVGTKGSSMELPDMDKDVQIDGAEIKIPEEVLRVDISAPSIDIEGPSIDMKTTGGEDEGKESKFKMPSLSFSGPQVKRPEIDLSLSKKDVDVTLPEAKAEVQVPDVQLEKPTAEVEIKAPEIKVATTSTEGSPSRFKLPTFKFPKFGVGTKGSSIELPDMDKDVQIDGAEIKIPEEVLRVDISAPSIDIEGPSIDMKTTAGEDEGKESKFKMPSLSFSGPQVKRPVIDLSLSKEDVDVTLPEATAEVKFPDVKVKEPEATISKPEAPSVEVEAKLKQPNWTFPKFSFSRTGDKVPDVDPNLETPKVDVISPVAKQEVFVADVEVQGSLGAISMKEPPSAEVEANLKKSKFSLPTFSFSKSTVKAREVSDELPHVDISLPQREVIVTQPGVDIKAPELEAEQDGQGTKFKLPKFSFGQSKAKGQDGDSGASKKDIDIALPGVKGEVRLPDVQVQSSANVEIKAHETETKSQDVGVSPVKFKIPAMKIPKIGLATYNATLEAPDKDNVTETDGSKLKEGDTVSAKGPSVVINMDESRVALTNTEMPKTETVSVALGSPSKFKLPSFKMPKLNFSRPKSEDENSTFETEYKEDEPEIDERQSKSPKMTLTSFGEIFKNFEVEFDVPKTDKDDEIETSKLIHETDEQLEPKEREANSKQDIITKSPERTGWFKFPMFGLSSPSEPAKTPEKEKPKNVGDTRDEEVSPAFSAQSSDAFADISSAVTSEHVGLSLSSPTKVTVKYSDPNAARGLEEMHSNVVTSTTRTELISFEPNLPEKITILSSGVSSSSEDTLRLESGKVQVIKSSIQATPEAQQVNLVSAGHIQSAGGHAPKSEATEAASWAVEDTQSGKRTVYERHLVRETSSERSESKETIVITKQITHIGTYDSSEPISGEAASSIQRLRDTMHSEKMRFFDRAKE